VGGWCVDVVEQVVDEGGECGGAAAAVAPGESDAGVLGGGVEGVVLGADPDVVVGEGEGGEGVGGGEVLGDGGDEPPV
jgi:hypothetical protein